MIKVVAAILLVVGAIGLILGVPGIFGRNVVGMSPWALAILGLIFFTSGVSMLKWRKDTDEV